MDMTITIKTDTYTSTHEFHDIEFLVQFLNAVLVASQVEFPYVVNLAAEQQNGKMIFSDDIA